MSTNVFFHEPHESEKYFVTLTIPNSINEDHPGLLHLLEHLMISPKSSSSEFHQILKRHNGNFNALTTPGLISIHFSGNSKNPEAIVKELIKAVKNLNLTDELIEYEVSRFEEEIRTYKKDFNDHVELRNSKFENYARNYSIGVDNYYSKMSTAAIREIVAPIYQQLLTYNFFLDVATDAQFIVDDELFIEGHKKSQSTFLSKDLDITCDCPNDIGQYYVIRSNIPFTESAYDQAMDLLSKNYPSFKFMYPLYRDGNEQLIYLDIDPMVNLDFKLMAEQALPPASPKSPAKIKTLKQLRLISSSRNIMPQHIGDNSSRNLFLGMERAHRLRVISP